MCFMGGFLLNMLDSSTLFCSLCHLHISNCINLKVLFSFVWVFIKQMNCRELYIILSPVYIQICLTMSDNDQQ